MLICTDTSRVTPALRNDRRQRLGKRRGLTAVGSCRSVRSAGGSPMCLCWAMGTEDPSQRQPSDGDTGGVAPRVSRARVPVGLRRAGPEERLGGWSAACCPRGRAVLCLPPAPPLDLHYKTQGPRAGCGAACKPIVHPLVRQLLFLQLTAGQGSKATPCGE